MTPPDSTRRRPRREAHPAENNAPTITAITAKPRVESIVQSEPLPSRAPTDFEGLQAIADLDRDAVRAAMDAVMGLPAGGAHKAGQRISGLVSNVGQQSVFVDIGGKSDAVIDRLELVDVRVGDRFDGFIHSTDGGEVRLTRTPSGGAVRDMMREAMASKMVIEGKISAVAESGWQVALSDGVRGFCPGSHTAAGEVADAALVGQTFAFHIHDMRGSDVVLSRRAIVEADEKARETERLGSLREGEVFDAVVVSLRDFGVFVKLPNGMEGMVHISNLAESRPKHPSEVLKEGDAVRVRVLGIDRARRRIDLGIRQAVEMAAGAKGAAPARGFDLFAGLLKDVKVRK